MSTKGFVTVLLALGFFAAVPLARSTNVSYSGSVSFDHDQVVGAYVYDCPASLNYQFLGGTVSLPQFDPGLGILEAVELAVASEIGVETHYFYYYDTAHATLWWYSHVAGSVGGLTATFSQGHNTVIIGQGYHDHAFAIDGAAAASAASGLEAFIGTGSVAVAVSGGQSLCAWWNPYHHLDTDTHGAVTATLTYNYTLRVAVDIKPGSYPNPLNLKSQGVLPVAILGTAGFDVSRVDPSSVELQGALPLRWTFEDVGTPGAAGGADGYLDLVLMYSTPATVAGLGPVSDGDVLKLSLTGWLVDGELFFGEDEVRILKKGK